MLKLYHAPMTRSLRIVWLLEELGLPYELAKVTFVPPTSPYSQATPFGKLPVLEDGDMKMFESGAILEYVLERYGNGRLAPRPGTDARGPYLQWVWFAEASLFPPMGEIAWYTVFKPENERIDAVGVDARKRAGIALGVLDEALAGKKYLLGEQFSAADVMMGYSLLAAQYFRVLGDEHRNIPRYVARLLERPALHKAMAL